MPVTEPPRHTPFWLKAARRQLARMDPGEAVVIAEDLLAEARDREMAILRGRLASLFEREAGKKSALPPLVLRRQDRVPPPHLLLPDWRIDR